MPKVNCKGLVGENLPRVDAVGKALGYSEYVDDMRIEGMIYGSAVRAKYPRALVKNRYRRSKSLSRSCCSSNS